MWEEKGVGFRLGNTGILGLVMLGTSDGGRNPDLNSWPLFHRSSTAAAGWGPGVSDHCVSLLFYGPVADTVPLWCNYCLFKRAALALFSLLCWVIRISTRWALIPIPNIPSVTSHSMLLNGILILNLSCMIYFICCDKEPNLWSQGNVGKTHSSGLCVSVLTVVQIPWGLCKWAA